MGKRGPAPMPTKLKLLHGETRKSRINHSEPEPRQKAPARPRGMSREALTVWDRVMREQAPGVILAADTDALRVYCESVVRYLHESRALNNQIARGFSLVPGARGGLVKNPLFQVVRDLADQVRQYARELGLTPSARTGLHLGDAKPAEDPLERWEKGATP